MALLVSCLWHLASATGSLLPEAEQVPEDGHYILGAVGDRGGTVALGYPGVSSG